MTYPQFQHTIIHMTTHTKKRTNVSIDGELLDLARQYNIKLSPLLEDAIRIHLKKIMAADWLDQNKDAIRRYNESVLQRGVFSDDLRTF